MRFLVLASFSVFLGLGQDVDSESTLAGSKAIKNVLDKQLQDHHLVGIAAVVIRSDAIIGIAASGVKRQGEKIPLDTTAMWHLGSNTKAITATMVARLVESGQLSWTVTPLEIFPELKQTMHPAYRKVTIEQLLSHHAGLPPYGKPEVWPHLSGSTVEQRAKFAALVLNRAPASSRGPRGFIQMPVM